MMSIEDEMAKSVQYTFDRFLELTSELNKDPRVHPHVMAPAVLKLASVLYVTRKVTDTDTDEEIIEVFNHARDEALNPEAPLVKMNEVGKRRSQIKLVKRDE
jgi:hypothetical protein